MNTQPKDTVYLEVDGKTIDCEDYDTSGDAEKAQTKAKIILKTRNLEAIWNAGDGNWYSYIVRVPG